MIQSVNQPITGEHNQPDDWFLPAGLLNSIDRPDGFVESGEVFQGDAIPALDQLHDTVLAGCQNHLGFSGEGPELN